MAEQIYNVRRWPDASHMLPFAVDMATAAKEADRLNRHSRGEHVSYDVDFDRTDTEDWL